MPAPNNLLGEGNSRRLRGEVKMVQTVEASAPAARVALGALFVGFLKVSLLRFGGGLVWARRIVVEQKAWMHDREFADTLTLCQFMPGPNIVGITVCVGSKLRGSIGAITAVAGFILLPWTVGLSLGGLYLRHARLPVLQNILGGLSAAAAGLMIATGLRLLMASWSRRRGHRRDARRQCRSAYDGRTRPARPIPRAAFAPRPRPMPSALPTSTRWCASR